MDGEVHQTEGPAMPASAQPTKSAQSLPRSATPAESMVVREQSCSPNKLPTVANDTGSDESPREQEPISANNAAELRRLASVHSIRSRGSLEYPDTGTTDPELDPASPQFDIYRWARTILTTMEDEHIPIQQTGFCFKDLNVYGSGPSLNIQKDVLSIFMAPFRLHEWINFGVRNRRRILHSFNGVVKSGEMLIVLGRPGSGCSTFLKTICGELHGLELDSKSPIHYNG